MNERPSPRKTFGVLSVYSPDGRMRIIEFFPPPECFLMSVPRVAIVGRPNVGKSSLFNWLAGKRIAIVDPTPGVTRDRVSTLVEIEGEGRYFELMDTGGMGIRDCDNLTDEVEHQIQLAIDQAHLILFVTDARSGLATLDEHVAARLRGLD